MGDWLQQWMNAEETLPAPTILILRVVIAAIFGFIVAAIHRYTLGRTNSTGTMATTLVLLSILIAIVTVVIGNNMARAFGLVGALSIVRFRTVVEDTRDTAFVIFAVIVGMAIGAGYLALAAMAVPIVAVAAGIMTRFDRPPAAAERPSATLTVRVGLGHDPETTLRPTLAKHGLGSTRTGAWLIGVSTARQGAALEFTYALPAIPPASMSSLVAELNRIEGVQGVEYKSTT